MKAYMKILTYFLYILAPPSSDERPESLEDQQKCTRESKSNKVKEIVECRIRALDISRLVIATTGREAVKCPISALGWICRNDLYNY